MSQTVNPEVASLNEPFSGHKFLEVSSFATKSRAIGRQWSVYGLFFKCWFQGIKESMGKVTFDLPLLC